MMSPEIRFNTFGIPYLVEFANVTFRSRSQSQLRSLSRSATMTSTGSTLALASVSDAHNVRPSRANSFRSVLSNLYKHKAASLTSEPRPKFRPARFPLRPSRLRPTPSTSSVDSDWTLATASSETLSAPMHAHAAYPDTMKSLPPEPKIELECEIECAGAGLLIRPPGVYAGPQGRRKLSEHRLARLKYRIARAVMAAGMDSSPAAELEDGYGQGRGAGAAGYDYLGDYDYRASISTIRSEEVVQHGLPSSLFRGTYGQVMAALKAAGLTTEPCGESGVEDATRLGALFVAHQNACGGVEFTRLTLWA